MPSSQLLIVAIVLHEGRREETGRSRYGLPESDSEMGIWPFDRAKADENQFSVYSGPKICESFQIQTLFSDVAA